jgi:NhaA family Na+:H+ antiporter
MNTMGRPISLLREFSIPLIAGVLCALFWANLQPEGYDAFINRPMLGGMSVHFISNELFMVLFFGIAAVEITQSVLPGGDLSPLRRAVNPLFATVGGVVGPILAYFILNAFFGGSHLLRGWGIPTATDIALAWLAARLIFGPAHPAVSYLLLLAVADDAIGLAIIAIFYPNPALPVEPAWLTLTAAGMLASWLLSSARVRSYWPYLIIGGVLSWTGLHEAHLHPALALVFVVPFLPHAPRESTHLFEEDPGDYSTLSRFEHEWKVVVDFGLFLFGLANAGVEFARLGMVTWIVLGALILGKGGGIMFFGWLAERFGYQLPRGMGMNDLLITGLIAGTGFTVALFVAGEAFVDPAIRDAAKMGAMFSISAALLAFLLARPLGAGKKG